MGGSAPGGGGLAEATSAGSSNRYNVKFDTDNLNIPDVTARTAKWLGVPMLPGMLTWGTMSNDCIYLSDPCTDNILELVESTH